MGISAQSLLARIASATIRQSDSEATASEAATASLSRVDAMATAGPLKPAGRKDLVMVEQIPVQADESLRATGIL